MHAMLGVMLPVVSPDSKISVLSRVKYVHYNTNIRDQRTGATVDSLHTKMAYHTRMALKGPKFLEYNEADFGTITEFNKETLEADKIYQ